MQGENAPEVEALPLLAYAGLVADHTAEKLYWRWRRSKARAAEGWAGDVNGDDLLRDLQLIAVRWLALAAVGAEGFEKLDAYGRPTYRSSTYWYGSGATRSAASGSSSVSSASRAAGRGSGRCAARTGTKHATCAATSSTLDSPTRTRRPSRPTTAVWPRASTSYSPAWGGTVFEKADLIHRYTRADAIRDGAGVCVDHFGILEHG